MKTKKILSVLLSLLLVLALVAGCAKGGGNNQPANTQEEPTNTPSNTDNEADAGDEDVEGEELEPYTFTHYFNYDWWDIKPWGEDEVSKYFSEKFNVHVEFSKPDADPEARLNVMVSSGDLPDSIMMDRGTTNENLARLGHLLPLEPFMEKNPNLQENLLEQTIEGLKIDGKLYGIPNWPRKAPTGGNDAWIYNLRIYQDAGSPPLETFEDLYAFCKKVKTDVPETREGLSTIPMTTDATGDGHRYARAFYRSYGGVINGWYTVMDGNYVLVFRDPVFKEASLEINKWWREGLISETQFTDTSEQILEKIVAGRTALLFYDLSLDETNHFRRILKENFPDDSYELTEPHVYPPAKGLPPEKIYGDHTSTLGWNVTCITTKAENPQRIFDLWSYFLTPEAAIIQMYGPQGHYWDELDEDGLPILKKPESELTTEEINRLGLWFWMMPGHSDNVDTVKFAVNAKLPPEKQNWVITNQAERVTPTKWLTDEFENIGTTIDPQSDLGIQRKLIEDYIVAEYPKMIMAETAEEAERIYDEIMKFAEENGIAEIEAVYTEKYKDNVARFGTGLTK